MILNKVGRNEWRSLKVGETGVFTLPNAKAVDVARVAVSQLKRLEGMDFERIDVSDSLTVAYKRIK